MVPEAVAEGLPNPEGGRHWRLPSPAPDFIRIIHEYSPDRRRLAILPRLPNYQARDLPAVNDAALELFLAACGSDEPLRLGVGQRDELPTETRSFRQPFLVIGRRPESDLVLDHWQVSRRHAYLQLIEGRYYCVDLGSRTGTYGGDATERSGWLERGRAIRIGPFAVRPEWPSTASKPSGPTPVVAWELPGRAIGQAVWRMDRHLALIGRSPACKIRIVEPDVSKFHCSVVLTPLGVWVVDLLGQKGVQVNEEAVRSARLEDGDELRIGRHTLRIRYDSPPLPLPRLDPPSPSRGVLATVEPTFPAPMSPTTGHGLSTLMGTAGGVVDPSVNLLVHQFGLMQQQMFDQFHQTMIMMFEGFAALHREQASSLREEFDQVRKLSEEIEALRRETARLAEEASRQADRPRPATNGHSMPTASKGRGAALPRPHDQAQAQAQAQAQPYQRATPPEPDREVDIHAQLCLRLSTIQTERQNRWQKILGMMSSRS
jgi:pSer/pThr/pTyr-binding forkhead associated (FHA) protein